MFIKLKNAVKIITTKYENMKGYSREYRERMTAITNHKIHKQNNNNKLIYYFNIP